MNHTTRRIEQNPLYIGQDEGVVFTLTVPTTWATNPASPAVTIYDPDGANVTSTTTTGTNASVSGQVITTARVTGPLYRSRNSLSAGGIVVGSTYLMIVRFTAGAGEKSCFVNLVGQK